MDVVTLLQSRNRCLQRFLKITMDFRETSLRGDFSGLGHFQARRDKLIKTLELYERKITATVNELKLRDSLDARRLIAARIQPELEARELLIQNILRVDQDILRSIDEERARVSRESGSTRKVKNQLKKFKSAWIAEAGEELDKTL